MCARPLFSMKGIGQCLAMNCGAPSSILQSIASTREASDREFKWPGRRGPARDGGGLNGVWVSGASACRSGLRAKQS